MIDSRALPVWAGSGRHGSAARTQLVRASHIWEIRALDSLTPGTSQKQLPPALPPSLHSSSSFVARATSSLSKPSPSDSHTQYSIDAAVFPDRLSLWRALLEM